MSEEQDRLYGPIPKPPHLTNVSLKMRIAWLNSKQLVSPSERTEHMGIPDGLHPGNDEMA